MSDSVHVAELRLKIQSDLNRFINEVAKVNTELGYTDGVLSKVEKSAQKLGTAFTGTGTAAGKTASAVKEGAAASKTADGAAKTHTTSLIASRYALYDVATTAGIASAALLAVAAVSTAAAITYETAFTSVERTTLASGTALESIRTQLLGLARDIPLAFGDITTIAALGAQLGIADADLAGFSQTVAEFAAATNVSVETAATAFGALGQLLKVPASQFENLGSSIALVGVNSVATETEILAVAQQIASYTQLAGMSAEQTIGLSGALASLRVPPEQARSAIQALFNTVNQATAKGGKDLDNFAHVLGLSTDATKELFKTNPEQFIARFADSLSKLDGQQLTLTLDALGLSEKRVSTVLTKLASNTDVLASSQADAAKGFQDGTFLSQVYGRKLDDIASKITILQNSLTELAAAAGNALTPVLGPVLDMLASFAQSLSDILSTPAGQAFAGVAIGATALTGALLGLVSTVALGIASMYAMRTAAAGLGFETATTGIRGMIGATLGLTTATGGTAVAMNVLKFALASTGIGLAVVLVGSLATAMMQASASTTQAFSGFVSSTAGLADAMTADQTAYKAALAAGNTGLADSYTQVSLKADDNTAKLGDNVVALKNTATVLGIVPTGFDTATGAIDNNTAALGANTIEWLKNQLMQSESFQQLAGNADFTNYWVTVGANIDDVIRASASGGQAAVIDYFSALEAQATASGAQFQSALKSFNIKGKDKSVLNDNPLMFVGGTDTGKGVSQISKALVGFNGQMLLAGQTSKVAATGIADAGDATTDLGNDLTKTTAKVVTFATYASDLGGVIQRAFDIRYAPSQGLDAITSQWQTVTKTSSDSAKAIRDATKSIEDYQIAIRGLNADQQQLSADRAVLEYFAAVANKYGDSLASADLAARLAKNSADAAKKQADLADAQKNLSGANTTLTDAQAASSKSLTGNSAAAVANRAQVLSLVSSYQDYIGKLAASGMSQADLAATSARLKQEFMAQATQAGYSSAEIDTYSKAFDDMKVAIDNVPRNITVDANTDPALQALNEFLAQVAASNPSVDVGVTVPDAGPAGTAAGLSFSDAFNAAIGVTPNGTAGRGMGVLKQDFLNSLSLGTPTFADGGYTGDGGMYQPAGIVHKGEYVFSKAATQNLGVDKLARLHSVGRGTRGYANGGLVGGGSGGGGFGGPTDLSAGTIMAIAQAVSQINVNLYTDDRRIAESSNRGTMLLASGGSN